MIQTVSSATVELMIHYFPSPYDSEGNNSKSIAIILLDEHITLGPGTHPSRAVSHFLEVLPQQTGTLTTRELSVHASCLSFRWMDNICRVFGLCWLALHHTFQY